jgi:hypothetical protein
MTAADGANAAYLKQAAMGMGTTQEIALSSKTAVIVATVVTVVTAAMTQALAIRIAPMLMLAIGLTHGNAIGWTAPKQ